jgi:hypothetical protein
MAISRDASDDEQHYVIRGDGVRLDGVDLRHEGAGPARRG